MLLRFLDIRDPEERQEAIRMIFFFVILVLIFVGISFYVDKKYSVLSNGGKIIRNDPTPTIYKVNEKGELEAVSKEEAMSVLASQQNEELRNQTSFIKSVIDFFSFEKDISVTEEKTVNIPIPPLPLEVQAIRDKIDAENRATKPLPATFASEKDIVSETLTGESARDYLIKILGEEEVLKREQNTKQQ